MRQVLALALAVFYAGAAHAQPLGEKEAAPIITSRTTTVQVSTMPEGAPTPATVVRAEQQQQGAGQEQRKKSFSPEFNFSNHAFSLRAFGWALSYSARRCSRVTWVYF